MEVLEVHSIDFIFKLQNVFSNYSEVMFLISKILDPKYAFFFYTPVLFAFNFNSGKQLLWTTVLTEYCNQILKWILHGDRPYWWVHTYSLKENLPIINQYPITCETGPGSPSGHAMITSAIFYIIFNYLLSKKSMKKMKIPVWTFHIMLIVLVSISRLFIAAHFPHQCIIGAILGLILAKIILHFRFTFENASFYLYNLTTLILFSSALLTYFLLNLFGFNANWSVELAQKYCNEPSWVHLDNSPLYSLMRYTGFLFGFGLGLNSSYFKESCRIHFTTKMKFITALISVIITKLTEYIIQPKSNLYALYLFGFTISSLLGFTYSAVAPHLSVISSPKLVHRKTSSIENC